MTKNLVLVLILTHLVQILAAKFFFSKNLAPSVTRYHGWLSSCTMSEKTNDSILRKLSDRQTEAKRTRVISSELWTDFMHPTM